MSDMAKSIVRLPRDVYDFVYRRSLGRRHGISGYMRMLAERDMAEQQAAPSIVPENQREKSHDRISQA